MKIPTPAATAGFIKALPIPAKTLPSTNTAKVIAAIAIIVGQRFSATTAHAFANIHIAPATANIIKASFKVRPLKMFFKAIPIFLETSTTTSTADLAVSPMPLTQDLAFSITVSKNPPMACLILLNIPDQSVLVNVFLSPPIDNFVPLIFPINQSKI